MLYFRHFFSPLNTFMIKEKDPEPEPDPYLWLMDPEGPKICGSGSGSPTLFFSLLTYLFPIISEVEADRRALRGGGGSRDHTASLLLGHLSNMLFFSVVFVVFSCRLFWLYPYLSRQFT
jgi:hypothetical protein